MSGIGPFSLLLILFLSVEDHHVVQFREDFQFPDFFIEVFRREFFHGDGDGFFRAAPGF